MDFTRQSIKKWLNKNYEQAKIVELDLKSGEEFTLLCRCKLGTKSPDKFCKTFVQKFSRFTLTNWLVSHSFPAMKRMLYRKGYICHLSTRNKKTNTKNSKRNKECSAKIDFKFKKINRNTCKTDKYLKEGLNAVIKINFHHSHSVRTLEAYSYLRCTPKTKKKYMEYFEMGISPNHAKAYNEIYIRSKYYNSKQREIQLANGMVNVGQPKLDHLYYDWRNEHRDFKMNSFARLKEEKELFEAEGIYLKIIENPKIVIVLTPLTKKVFSIHGDEVFIDSSGCSDREVSYITSLFVPTHIGALPIGYILHNGNTEEEYEEGFKVLMSSLCEFCDKPFRPKIIMTKDGEQVGELSKFFPRSSIELCAYLNYGEFWDFLWNKNHKVNEEDRKRLMTRYYDVLNSQMKTECLNLLQELLQDAKVQSNTDLKYMIERLWENSREWAPKSDNVDLKLAQSERDKQNLMSTQMRIYKDVVIEIIQKFSVYALVKLMTGPIEDMYKRYLTQFALEGKVSTPLFALFIDKPVNFNILPVGPNEYMVQSLKELDSVCYVYTDIIFCTCNGKGTMGFYCIHLCAVEYEFPFHPSPAVNETEKNFFYFPESAAELIESQELIEPSDDDDDDDKNSTKNENDDIYNDNTVGEIKTETVPIETSDLDMNDDDDMDVNVDDGMDINDVASAEPVGLKNEVQRISKLLKTSKKKSKPLKKVLDTLKEAISSCDEYEEPQPSTSKQVELPTSTQDEESDIISKGWGITYKKLAHRQKIFAKKAIDDILFEASLGTLGRNSVVINANSNAIDPFQVKSEELSD